jgi:hypothetical protein
MQDAFIDNTIIKEEVIHKIVDVKVWDDEVLREMIMQKKIELKANKPKKEKKKKKRSREEQSDTEELLDVDEEELIGIKFDISVLKGLLREIQRKFDFRTGNEDIALKSIENWFKNFDQDGSDEIELNEFINMIKYLNLSMDNRIGIMFFRLFDRSD